MTTSRNGTIVGMLASAVAAWAETEGGSVAAPEALTLPQLMEMGGWLMYVLAALSVLGLALIGYYALVLRTRAIAPPAQTLRLRELLKERRGRDARELCAQQPTALAAVTAAGLDFLKENPHPPAGMLKEIMESEGGRQAGRMQNMIHYLLDWSAGAPMVGRLGTVIGMLKAFNAVSFDLAKARAMELYAISQYMNQHYGLDGMDYGELARAIGERDDAGEKHEVIELRQVPGSE